MQIIILIMDSIAFRHITVVDSKIEMVQIKQLTINVVINAFFQLKKDIGNHMQKFLKRKSDEMLNLLDT